MADLYWRTWYEQRCAEDPGYAERRRAQKRECQRRRRATDPEYLKSEAEKARARNRARKK